MGDQAGARSRGADADSEEGLVAAAARGDERAFEALVRRHAGVVLGLARRLLPHGADAEDVVQEVFIKVHRALPGFRGESSVRSWICQVAVNAARNRRRDESRREARLRPVSQPADAAPDAARPEDLVRDPRPDQERVAASTQARARIEAALAELPEEFREAVVLRDVEGLSYEEIAQATGAEVGTVKSRIARGRGRLQAALADLVGGASP